MEGPQISRFVFPLPPQFVFFLPSPGVFSWNFGGVLKRQNPQMCTFAGAGPPAVRRRAVRRRREGGGREGTQAKFFQAKLFSARGRGGSTQAKLFHPEGGVNCKYNHNEYYNKNSDYDCNYEKMAQVTSQKIDLSGIGLSRIGPSILSRCCFFLSHFYLSRWPFAYFVPVCVFFFVPLPTVLLRS